MSAVTTDQSLAKWVLLASRESWMRTPGFILVTEGEHEPSRLRFAVQAHGYNGEAIRGLLYAELQDLAARSNWMSDVHNAENNDVVISLHYPHDPDDFEAAVGRVLAAMPFLLSPSGDIPVYTLRKRERQVIVRTSLHPLGDFESVEFWLPGEETIETDNGLCDYLTSDIDGVLDTYLIVEGPDQCVRVILAPEVDLTESYGQIVSDTLAALGKRLSRITSNGGLVFVPVP